MTVLSTRRQEIFHVTLYDFINPSIFDVRYVEHSEVQYQGRALSVAQNFQYSEISGWFICKVTGPNNLLEYDHLTIPWTYLKTQLC